MTNLTQLKNEDKLSENEPSFSPFPNGTEFYLVDNTKPVVLTKDGWHTFESGNPEKYSQAMLLSISTDLAKCDFDTWLQALENVNKSTLIAA